MAPDTGQLVAAILNSAWMVRHYARGATMRPNTAAHKQRAAAIRKMGLVVRDAINSSEDFEPLLAAICDGLKPHDVKPPF